MHLANAQWIVALLTEFPAYVYQVDFPMLHKDISSFPDDFNSLKKKKKTKLWKPTRKKNESVLASFQTLPGLKVKLLKHSPNYATNTHHHELVCKILY